MTIGESFLAEFEMEAATTRKMLELVPFDKFDWAPHFKSFTMGALAGHIAMLTEWAIGMLTDDFIDFESWQRPPAPTTPQELLDLFDSGVAKVKILLVTMDDEKFMQPWTLKSGEHIIFTQPRIGVLRGMVFNHLVHHRAQLGVYLRMNDVPLPSSYGPSADESMI